MNSPKSVLDVAVTACVGFLVCVVALTVALCLLARIWYWLLLLVVLSIGIWLLVQWLRNHFGRW